MRIHRGIASFSSRRKPPAAMRAWVKLLNSRTPTHVPETILSKADMEICLLLNIEQKLFLLPYNLHAVMVLPFELSCSDTAIQPL
jgi:hypothetical protein